MATAARRTPVAVTTLVVRRRPPADAAEVALDSLAHDAGLHPELVRRLIALGALEPAAGTRADPRYPRDAASHLARVARLRRELGLSWNGALLAYDLLARIEQLEERLRRYEPIDDRPR
jgi:MerR HTH family regulatory protein